VDRLDWCEKLENPEAGMVTIFWAAALTFMVSGVLAGLLVVAERFIINYGRCSIDINDGRKVLRLDGGKTLLDSLRMNDIFIPSACGGRGTCAYCKVKVVAGGGPVVPTETPLLSRQEISESIRISCQCKVRNDMRIVIPDELLAVREYTGLVERIRDLTHDIKELRIRLIEPADMEFVPGQYVQLQAPPYGSNPEGVYRAYSISSPPHDKGYIELIIRLVPGGICTTWVFTVLKEGDKVSLSGPYGRFQMSGTDVEMFWIAGGSGMAPFWSMIRRMKHDGVGRKCTFFFGAVKKKDVFFLDELRGLEKQMPNFRFMPALSAPEPADDWDGEKGLITEVVGRCVGDGGGKEGYLCGSPGMIDAAIKVLNDKGISADRIFYDKFA